MNARVEWLVWSPAGDPMPMASKDNRRRRRSLRKKQGGGCLDCGVDVVHEPSQIHHVVPLSQGGDNSLDNLVLLCPECHGWRHLTG